MNIDMNVISENKQKVFDAIGNWIYSLSERTLTITSIVILHSVFIPQIYAYMNSLTDKLPSFDSYLLVVVALGLLNLRAILKRDSVACLVHMVGFICQLVLVALVLMK